jgi:hypothetical protein
MVEHTASFDIDSKTDSYAAERILEQVYNTVREETRTVRDETDDDEDILAEFRAVRDAAERRKPGRLTITYEQYADDFED